MAASSTELGGFMFVNVTEERVKKVSDFQVSDQSDFTEGNLIGLVIYDLDGHREFEIEGKPIEEGYIYFRSPESIEGFEGETYHAKLFYSLFGDEWKNYRERMTVSGFARQNGEWKRTSRTLNGNLGKNYSPDMEAEMSDYEFENVIKHCKDFLGTPYYTPYHELTNNPVKKDDNHSNAALKFYHDLMHIRDHILYHDFHKQAPRLLKLPVVCFLAAMSANQHSKHPVRDAGVDIAVESTAFTAMGLAIGNGPAAIALFASHVAEKGLEHFPSWEQIDKMPRTTTQERLAFSRMIEVRATAELLAFPGKATEIISRYIKSLMDSKDLPKSNALAAPSQFLPPLAMNFTPERLSFSLTKDKPAGLTLFSSLPHSDHKLLAMPKLTDCTSTQTDMCKIHFQLPKQETKPYLSTPLPKLTGLSDGLAPKTGWDTLRIRSADVSLSTGFSLKTTPLTAWDKLAKSEFRSEFFSPSKAFGLSSASSFSLPGASLSLLTEPNTKSASSHSSRSLFQPHFTQQPSANAWDKLRDKGSFNVKGFSK